MRNLNLLFRSLTRDRQQSVLESYKSLGAEDVMNNRESSLRSSLSKKLLSSILSDTDIGI